MGIAHYLDASDERLQAYINEAVYRWNTRKESQSKRFADTFGKSVGVIVKWSELKLCDVTCFFQTMNLFILKLQ